MIIDMTLSAMEQKLIEYADQMFAHIGWVDYATLRAPPDINLSQREEPKVDWVYTTINITGGASTDFANATWISFTSPTSVTLGSFADCYYKKLA